jgi:hypothetical protein
VTPHPKPDKEPLKQQLLKLARYANTLTPYKLDEPLDPIVEAAIDALAGELQQQHEAEVLSALINELESFWQLGAEHGIDNRIEELTEQLAHLKQQQQERGTDGEEKS